MKTQLKKVITAFVSIFLFCLASVSPAYAEQAKQYLQMTPIYINADLDPGTKYEDTITLRNMGTEPLDFTLEAAPYTVSGQNYDQDFSLETNYTKVADWFEFETETGTLGAEEKVQINYSINVPEDAPGGGQYAAIIASIVNNTQPEEANSINIIPIGRTAALFYGHVNGETRECGEVESNNVPMLFFAPPISANSVVSNCGNIDLEAKYSLKVSSLFSDEDLYDSSVDQEADTSNIILPETSRFHSMSWKNAPSFGIYNVEQSIEYVGKTNTVKKLVFVIPLWLLIVFIALIGLIVFKLVSNSQRRKSGKSSK